MLHLPADGVPDVTADAGGLSAAAERLRAGSGPVAVDAERASGHRYGQRAFLFQVRREGAGTWLIDPAALGDLTPLADAIADTEWILHAATQDLPCLAERGLRPRQLFDTELAGRLLGLPRVGLAPLTEDLLNVGLAKGHGRPTGPGGRCPGMARLCRLGRGTAPCAAGGVGAATRGRRPHRMGPTGVRLPDPMAAPTARRPWRRTRGAGSVRDPRGLAIVRALWETREQAASAATDPRAHVVRRSDRRRSEGPTQHLEALRGPAGVRAVPASWRGLVGRGPGGQRLARVGTAAPLPRRWPAPARYWERRDPVAAARLARVRQAIGDRADALGIPAEVLIAPDLVRVLVWETDGPIDSDQVRQRLQPARPWQLDEVAELIAGALFGVTHDTRPAVSHQVTRQ